LIRTTISRFLVPLRVFFQAKGKHHRGAKNAARPSAATKQSDFEQEQTESTEAETTLFSVLSVISCSKNTRIVRAI
jgi:hypothetical protein